MFTRTLFSWFRLMALSSVVGLALFCFAACSHIESKDPRATPQFADGWREHATPMFYSGFRHEPGFTSWKVPDNLPAGYYRVIERKDGEPELVDAQRIEIGDNPEKEVFVILQSSYFDPEVLNEKYILGLDGSSKKP